MTEPGLVVLPGPYGGHPGSVFTVSYSPDGALLASGGWDGTVRLRDARSGDEVGVLAGHSGPVRSVIFAPDGAVLASVGRDRTVRLWDTVSRTSAGVLHGHEGPVLSAVFAPDGTLLATASGDKTIRLWNPRDGTQLAELRDDARAVAFSPDGRVLASAGRDGTIRLWPVVDRTGVRDADTHGHATLTGHAAQVLSVAFAPDGTLLASAADDGTVRLWNPRDGTQLAELRDDARAVAFSPKDGTLASAGHDSGVSLWNLDGFPGTPAPAERSAVLGRTRNCHALAFAPDGARLACANDAGDVRVYDLADGAEPTSLAGHTCEILSVACSPDGALLATGDVDGAIRVWRTTDGSLARRLALDREWVRSCAFSADGALLASAGDDGTVRLWDGGDGSAIRIVPDRARVVRSVAFTPDSATLVSVGDDGRINRWNARSGVRIGSGREARPAPPVPGIRSDEPSRDDLLGVDADVEMLATLVTAVSTNPPLAVALLGEWGAGKSSVMLQVQDAVARIAARARRDPGDGAFAGNVCQVRFNAWHYSDDQVWTGLIEHLFRALAATASADRTPPGPQEISAVRARLRQQVADQKARCAELASPRHRTSRGLAALGRKEWRERPPALLTALLAVTVFVLGAFQPLTSGLLAALGRAWGLSRPLQQVTAGAASSLDDEARQARERLAELEDELAQVDAAARLARLLERRGDLDPYRGWRGLLGQVRSDLQQLATDLDDLKRERTETGQFVPPPLERVILYIDDLDRCSPARVVEVLSAVHLMLALPMFVVIVAVDPRWLLAALRHHYRDLFTVESGAFGPGDQPATPLDYLDKIFQIPFTVRSLSPENAAGYLTRLLGQEPDGQGRTSQEQTSQEQTSQEQTSQEGAGQEGAGQEGAGQEGAGQKGTGQEQASRDHAGRGSRGGSGPGRATAQRAIAGASLVRDKTRDKRDKPAQSPDRAESGSSPSSLPAADRPSPAGSGRAAVASRPAGLVLRAPETEFMVRLGPLLRTPRAAKKLVNLYRLVRIGVPEEDLPTFIGLGGYQVVQILLAILVGAPDAAPAIFTAIGAADTAVNGADTEHTDTERGDVVAVIGGAGTAAAPRIAEFVGSIRQRASAAVADIRVYQRWCPALARYSFYTRALADQQRPAPDLAD